MRIISSQEKSSMPVQTNQIKYDVDFFVNSFKEFQIFDVSGRIDISELSIMAALVVKYPDQATAGLDKYLSSFTKEQSRDIELIQNACIYFDFLSNYYKNCAGNPSEREISLIKEKIFAITAKYI